MDNHVNVILAVVAIAHAAAALGGVLVSLRVSIMTPSTVLRVIRILRLITGLMFTYTGVTYGLYFLGIGSLPHGDGLQTWFMLFGSTCASFYILFTGLYLWGRDG